MRLPALRVSNLPGMLTFHTEDTPDAVILHIEGEVDLATASSLQQELDRLLGRRRSIVLILGDVDYFDLSGVRVVESVHDRARESDLRLIVAGASPIVLRVARILELDRKVPFVETADAGLSLIRRGRF